jgi:methionyl-tRNA formyltransferase
MKILFLTRETWYSNIMANYILKNFPNSKIVNKPIKKIDKKYDYIIATGYQKIISNQILSKAKIKALNIHPGSIYNPGAGCYSYPIFNKEKFSGVTCHELSAKPDTGTVLIEKRFILYSNDDFTSLQGRTLVTVLQIFYEIMDIIIQKKKFPISKNQWKRKPRYQKNYINDLLNINLKRDTKNIIQLKIRSANPSYPGPYVDIDGVKKTVRIINGKLKVVDKKFVKSFKYGK